MNLRNKAGESNGVSASFENGSKREGESAQSSQRTIDGASSRGRTCDLSRATAAAAETVQPTLLRRLAKSSPQASVFM